jgi:hypothetical protein
MFGSSLFIPTLLKTCVRSPFHTEKMPFSRCQPFLSLQISASLSRRGLRMCFRSPPSFLRSYVCKQGSTRVADAEAQ